MPIVFKKLPDGRTIIVKEGEAEVENTAAPAAPTPRAASSIAFPYVDLAEGIAVARAMHESGARVIERDQLAAKMGQQQNSGSFGNKLSAARQFGFIEPVQGGFKLTPRGFEVLDPARAAAAKVDAFLAVPLYRKVYDEFRGVQLPPRQGGLESAFEGFGVAPKQTTNARLAFDRSAKQAGFFEHGTDKLVAPVISAADTFTEVVRDEERTVPTADPVVQGTTPKLHHFVQGLIDELPTPRTEWAHADRAKWLQAAAQIFELIYKADGAEDAVVITVTVADKK